MQGIFLDLKWSRSLYQPLSYRKTPNGVKLHVFSAREHQQAIISGDGVFPQIFELFPVLSLKIVFYYLNPMVLYVVHHYSYSNGHSHVGRGQH